LVKNVRFFYCISIEHTIFFQWAYARVVLSNAFEVAKKLFWFIILKYYRKKNQNPSIYKKLKHTVQIEQRKAYWKYIENIIFDLPIKDSDQHQYSDYKPKKAF
jgi:hypothetical protein